MILLVLGALLGRSVLILLVLTQGAGNFHIHLLNIIVLTLLCGRELPSFGYFLDLFVPQADNHIFWLEIGMDNLAHAVDIVEPNKALLSQSSDKRQWYTFIIVSFNDLQEVHSQNLKDHNKMFAIWSMVDKRV